MGRKTWLITSIILGFAVLVGLGLIGAVVYLRMPTGKAAEPAPGTLFVSLTQPFDSSRPALGEPVPVAAEAVGNTRSRAWNCGWTGCWSTAP